MNDQQEFGLDIKGGGTASALPAISRKEFISRVVKGAAITGGVLLAPKVLDKFLIRAAYATTSTSVGADQVTHPVGGGTDGITLPSGAIDSGSSAVKVNGGDNGGWN
jgi:hypothetical protein